MNTQNGLENKSLFFVVCLFFLSLTLLTLHRHQQITMEIKLWIFQISECDHFLWRAAKYHFISSLKRLYPPLKIYIRLTSTFCKLTLISNEVLGGKKLEGYHRPLLLIGCFWVKLQRQFCTWREAYHLNWGQNLRKREILAFYLSSANSAAKFCSFMCQQ